MSVVWWDDGIVEAAEAKISVAARGVQLGYGCFETFRVYGGVPFRLWSHLARLQDAAATLRLAVPGSRVIEQAVCTTLDANRLRDAAVRVVVLSAGVMDGPPGGASPAHGMLRMVPPRSEDRGRVRETPQREEHNAESSASAPYGASASEKETANDGTLADDIPLQVARSPGEPAVLYVTTHPVPDWTSLQSSGAVATISRIRRDPLSPLRRVKPTGALAWVVARNEAIEADADEAILLTTDGYLSETASANLFVVSDGVLLTPSLDCGCLPGVTRAAVLELAPQLGLSVSEGRFRPALLHTAEECFMTGSVREVVPIVSVDSHDIGAGRPGAITRDVHAAYREIVREEVAAARG
jgi:branched-chain amino acid aminotransferase